MGKMTWGRGLLFLVPAAALAGCGSGDWPTLAAPVPTPSAGAPEPVAMPAPARLAELPAPAEATALRARVPYLVDDTALAILQAEEAFDAARAGALRSGLATDARAAELALSRLGRVETDIAARLRALDGLMAASEAGERAEIARVHERIAAMQTRLADRLARERRELALGMPPS